MLRFTETQLQAIPSSDAKTMTKQVPRYTSIDLTYEILGRAAFVEDMSVVIVNTYRGTYHAILEMSEYFPVENKFGEF